jgi:hypothetical protein
LDKELDKKAGHCAIEYDSDVKANRWLPGSIDLFTPDFFKMPKDLPPGEINVATDSISLPFDSPVGKYTLSVTLNETFIVDPVARLGIKGRRDDGWYPVSKIQVVKK